MNRIPDSFHLQWHLTERCNLRCSHCYLDEELAKDEMDFAAVKGILEQYFGLLEEWRMPRERNRISFTGGEPFVRSDIFDILEICSLNRQKSRFGVLTNGLFATPENVGRLRAANVDYVQISIEGSEPVNDAIRGRGTYRKAVAALERLSAAGIETAVSMTVHKKNLDDVPALVSLCRKLKVKGIGIRRLVPWGRGRAMSALMLSPLETRKLFEFVLNTRRKFPELPIGLGCEDGIAVSNMHYVPAGCSCGYASVTVLPNGNIYPCRRLPILVGSLKTESLKDIFQKSEHLEKIRRALDSNEDCRMCPFFNECSGGAQCISYAYWGRLGKADPQCWRKFSVLPPVREKIRRKIKRAAPA